MTHITVFLIKIYQKTISPLMPARCRYYPSCSSYAIDSLRKYGFLRGCLRASRRVLRCNPWGKGGHDPA